MKKAMWFQFSPAAGLVRVNVQFTPTSGEDVNYKFADLPKALMESLSSAFDQFARLLGFEPDDLHFSAEAGLLQGNVEGKDTPRFEYGTLPGEMQTALRRSIEQLATLEDAQPDEVHVKAVSEPTLGSAAIGAGISFDGLPKELQRQVIDTLNALTNFVSGSQQPVSPVEAEARVQ